MIWSLGSNVLAGATNRVGSSVIEGAIISLSQLEFGMDNVSTYLTLCVGIYIFKRFLINWNWRYTQLMTTTLIAGLNLAWLIPITCKHGWCRNPWFCISIDSSEQLVQGITQVLMSMAVVELAPKGLEATTYELLVSVANSFITVNVIVTTQLMAPFSLAHVNAANEDQAADDNMARYTYVITGLNVVGVVIFVWFFPANREQCHTWKEHGGHDWRVAFAAVTFTFFSFSYATTCSILGLLPSTSCLQFIGGNGC